MKLENCNNILCTVSAGYSSMLMAIHMKEWYPNHNIVYAFANTGKEDKRSLDFLKECADYYGLDIVYLEPIISSDKGVGTNYAVRLANNLDLSGIQFEYGIQKYGIPSVANKWCNRELKLVPMQKYCDDIFGKNNWSVAIGIRIDEIDRVSESYKTNNIFYPLVEHKIDSRLRNKFWSEQPIKLKLKAFEGNCTMCFEKSDRKRMTVYKYNPKSAIWWDEMEQKYSLVPIDGKDVYNGFVENGGAFFGRGNRSIKWLVEQAQKPFREANDEYVYESDLFDAEDECGNACVIFK